jgi:hypothetical protein
MKQSTLPQARVQFIENREQDLHTYMFGLQELSGVTSMLKQVLFYNKYNGISEDVLRRAALRGTAIHEAVQAYLMDEPYNPATDTLEYEGEAMRALNAWMDYEKKSEIMGTMSPDSVEYIVSNFVDLATKVDVVFRNKSDDTYILGDIKTTSEYDEEYLSWQLSVEADMFRVQTGKEVSMLIAMWYNRTRGTWQVCRVNDKGHDAVIDLIIDWRNGMQREPMQLVTDYPAPIITLGQMYRDLESEIKRLETERSEFRSRMMQLMKDNNIKSVKLEGFSATYVEPTERRSFDVKKLLAAHPELTAELDDYYKTSNVSESIHITL